MRFSSRFSCDRTCKGLGDRIVLPASQYEDYPALRASLLSASRISGLHLTRGADSSLSRRSGDLALPLQKVAKGATQVCAGTLEHESMLFFAS